MYSGQGGNQSMLCLDLRGGLPLSLSGATVAAFMADNAPCYYLLAFSQNIQAILRGNPFGLRRAVAAPAAIPDARRYSAQALMRLVGGDDSALRSVDLTP
ncbi:MAG: hypothetical protein Rhims3KO_14620 [Hyphomicrobiales bacterium]